MQMKPDYFTLGQLLRFFYREDDTIQICYRDGDWEDFDEVNTSRSILLESFEDWYVKDLNIESSTLYDNKPVLRVELWKGAEQMIHNKEGRPLAYWYAPASYKSAEYCSNCHERTRSEGDDGEKYCINCGAEMIDEQAYRKMRDRGLC